MVNLDERHQTFVQALMRRGPLPEKESKIMFETLFRCPGDGFCDFLAAVNKELEYVEMEVRGSAYQYDGMVYYGIVNKLVGEQAKLGTRYTHVQISFFKAVMEEILQDSTGSGVITSMQALNLHLDRQGDQQSQAECSKAMHSTRLTLAAKEETLASLMSDQWLSRTDKGQVALGVRAFLELRSLFKNFHVPFCDVCNEAGIKAQPCQNEDCNVRMHSYCVPRKYHCSQVARVCPGCGTDWKAGDNDEDDNHDLSVTNQDEEEDREGEDTEGLDEAAEGISSPVEPVRQLRSRSKSKCFRQRQ